MTTFLLLIQFQVGLTSVLSQSTAANDGKIRHSPQGGFLSERRVRGGSVRRNPLPDQTRDLKPTKKKSSASKKQEKKKGEKKKKKKNDECIPGEDLFFKQPVSKQSGCYYDANCDSICGFALLEKPIRIEIQEDRVDLQINLFDYVINSLEENLQVTSVNGNSDLGDENGVFSFTTFDDIYDIPGSTKSQFNRPVCDVSPNDPDSFREFTPLASFDVGSFDGNVSLRQNIHLDTGVESCISLTGYSIPDLHTDFAQVLSDGETMDINVTFTIQDTSTGLELQGELVVTLIGANDHPFLDGPIDCDGGVVLAENNLQFYERRIDLDDSSVSFGILINNFVDFDCKYPITYGTVTNGRAVLTPLVLSLPFEIEGDNGGLYRFEEDGTIMFVLDPGAFILGEKSSIQISIADSDGTEGPLFALTTFYVEDTTRPCNGPDCGGGGGGLPGRQ